ncbi:hypothetical protein [Burkholderia cepacia]|uniref:hypothetical protein n=1 Tax=Burkholderia cepacia TaxID=292 RepID=UPI000A94D6CD|nr:hypothetical protein [Burkholderia cepacia]
MKKRDLTDNQIRDAWLAVGGFALGVVLVCAVTHMPGGSSDWAAWVQAVGSVIAILAAIWISRDQYVKQTKKDEAKERAEIGRTLGLLRMLISNLNSNLQKSIDRLTNDTEFENRAHRASTLKVVKQIQQSLYEVPLQWMPNEKVAIVLLNARWNVDKAAETAERRNQNVATVNGQVGQRTEWHGIVENLRPLIKELDDQLKIYSIDDVVSSFDS